MSISSTSSLRLELRSASRQLSRDSKAFWHDNQCHSATFVALLLLFCFIFQHCDYLPHVPNMPQARAVGRVKPRSAAEDWFAVGFDPWSAGREPLSAEFIPTLSIKQVGSTVQEAGSSVMHRQFAPLPFLRESLMLMRISFEDCDVDTHPMSTD